MPEIKADTGLCQGYGNCVASAEDLFDLTEEVSSRCSVRKSRRTIGAGGCRSTQFAPSPPSPSATELRGWPPSYRGWLRAVRSRGCLLCPRWTVRKRLL